MQYQTTVASSISVSGKGLHTGQHVTVTFEPAPVDYGIQFVRVDLPGEPVIKASPQNVFDTSRGTSIQEGGAQVHTIEHLMASLVGLGVDNVRVLTQGPETPILDGSARVYVEMLREAGIKFLAAPRRIGRVSKEIKLTIPENSIELIVRPADHFKMTVHVDYGTKVLAAQEAVLNNIEDFYPEVYNCRTFVFLNELQYLIQHNLVKGGDVDNAIVFVDQIPEKQVLKQLSLFFNKPNIEVTPHHVLNNISLRFENEPARHKLLDLLGDLYLIGVPLQAEIIANRPGHFANTTFAKQILENESFFVTNE